MGLAGVFIFHHSTTVWDGLYTTLKWDTSEHTFIVCYFHSPPPPNPLSQVQVEVNSLAFMVGNFHPYILQRIHFTSHISLLLFSLSSN